MEISLDIPALAARILDLASARKVYSSAGTQYTMGEQAFQKALQSALDDVVLRMQDHHQALQACCQNAPDRAGATLYEHVTDLLARVQILQESVDFAAQQAQAPADLLSGSAEKAIPEDGMDTRYTESEGLDVLRVGASVLQRTFLNGSRMMFSFASVDADRIRGLSVNRCAEDAPVERVDITLGGVAGAHCLPSVTPALESISTTDTEVVADNDITPAQPDAAESDGAKSES